MAEEEYPSSLTIDDLWELLTDLSQDLPTEDRTRKKEEEEVEDDDSDDDEQIPERFVFTRYIMRQSTRFQDYVEEQLIGAARESWALIVDHSARCPGVIDAKLERRITEVLEELVSRSPIEERHSS